MKSYIRAEPRLYLDGELWLAEGWHYSDGTQNGLYTESSTYFISRWGEVFAQSEFGTYKGSRGYEDYTAPATAKINLGNIKGNLSATENNKVIWNTATRSLTLPDGAYGAFSVLKRLRNLI